MDDLFLKIISGEIPNARVYEDAQTVAFLDIRPCNKGHTLVIPRTPYRNIFDMDAAAFGALAQTTHTIALAVQKATGADGINIVINNEKAAGQEIFHAHFHIIPRFNDDHVFSTPTHLTYAAGEIDVYAKNIKKALEEDLS